MRSQIDTASNPSLAPALLPPLGLQVAQLQVLLGFYYGHFSRFDMPCCSPSLCSRPDAVVCRRRVHRQTGRRRTDSVTVPRCRDARVFIGWFSFPDIDIDVLDDGDQRAQVASEPDFEYDNHSQRLVAAWTEDFRVRTRWASLQSKTAITKRW